MPQTPQSVFLSGAFPAELRLMLHCARWPIEEAAAGPASGDLDWNYFLSLCRHHRVAPQVYRALSHARTVPEDVLGALKADANENALSVFRYLAETQRLCGLLAHAGIAVRVLKGVLLSQTVFGDPGIRAVGDIDLLIRPGAEEAADRILLADGFHRGEPGARLTPRRSRFWRKFGKDYTYRDDRNGFEVDLHWKLFRNPYHPGNALAGSDTDASSTMRLGDATFAVLPLERTFLYLCVHGALDGWFRFKSLVDIATLWRGFSTAEKAALIDRAREFQVLSEMAAALALAEELRFLPPEAVPPALQLQTDSREVRWILDYARTQHLAQRFQPTPDGAGSWALKRYEFGLRRGLAYRVAIVRRILLRPRIWQSIDLPDVLFPLYAFLSPLEWFSFHRRMVSRDVSLTRPGRWKRWRALPSADRRLLAEAFAALSAARSALALLPVRWIFRWLNRPAKPGAASQDTVERIRWAVLTVARYGPLSFVCFPQALAAHAMLRRRGIGSVMHYGVRRSADRQLRAHTWLEVDHRMLLGGESAPLFAPIHSAGSSEPS